MVDDVTSRAGAAPLACPWCSAPLPAPDAASCGTCGAALVGDAETELPGVTAVDPEAVARGAREAIRQPRSRLLSWIAGEYGEATPTGGAAALAPPDDAVRREILRLELEAALADRRAELDSIRADEAAAASTATAPDAGATELDPPA